MREVFKRIWFPLLVVCVISSHAVSMGVSLPSGDPGYGLVSAQKPQKPDTIRYRNIFMKGHSTSKDEYDESMFLEPIDTVPLVTARDSIFPPDSLKDIDPFRYKYYVAIIDSLVHTIVSDSLKQAGDSIDWPILDSLYTLEYKARKKAEFDAWYAGLSKAERKKYEIEQKEKRQRHLADSVQAVKDSLGFIRDSIRQSTPRILETFALPDSMLYKRIIQWTHEREFHKMDVKIPDTTANFRFHDYPFYRKDVNASWLGVAGSALQYYNYFNRGSENGLSFYEPYESWTYSAKTLPFYNTKTAYTELSYTGTLFANSQKESDNLHILTSQNLFPSFNYTLEYNRFGGKGIVENEATSNKTFSVSTNYTGKKYLMHAGYIHNKVARTENGGITDLSMVRDTTLDAREYSVHLTNASSQIIRKTFFLDQQYRIPFTFINRIQENKMDKAYRERILASGDSTMIAVADSLVALAAAERAAADSTDKDDITTAFIGHSSEYSVFRKKYTDQISASDAIGRQFYNNSFLYNPTNSYDSVRVSKLENRLFIRLQPWAEDAIVSKLNGGVGNRITNWYDLDPTFLKGNTKTIWNSTFVYAGVEGQLRDYIHWNATGDYVFLGSEMNDMSLKGNLLFTLHPFRRARKSPVNLNLRFETSVKEPEHYHNHFFSNHYKWDNDFGKTSTTKLQAKLDIPKWKTSAEVGYALLDGNIYFDSLAVVRQNTKPMSVLSASLNKDLAFGPVHLDNRILFQVSSNQDVVPVPTLAANSRLYLQFDISQGTLRMQIGGDVWYNTKYYSSAWNPAVGVFYNQKKERYNNGPVIDAFVNAQWKRACAFVKVENVGQGWPMEKFDYFSAHNYIRTQRALKFGVYWPFYLQPTENSKVSASSGLSSGGSKSGSRSSRSSSRGGLSRGR
ncbi:MAG: putative porin [Bacteroidales bacterium]|nr:putative porin [Bacteroidales bacterium]